jgi:uncharacterized protein with NAD-binding domain and iron-sulfur cluster/nitrite reductase/ring-hydroxylating ferredoxin subunit
VNQLRVELGGSPHFGRADFPFQSPFYPFRLELEPLSRNSIAKYVFVEAPPQADIERDERLAGEIREVLNRLGPSKPRGSLYRNIRSLLFELKAEAGIERVQAWVKIIDDIIHEGEDDHFRFFLDLFHGAPKLFGANDAWSNDPPNDPAAPLVRVDTSSESDPSILALANVANQVYWCTLLLLEAAYGDRQRVLLRRAAVDLMTLVLDTLGLELAARNRGLPFDRPQPDAVREGSATSHGLRLALELLDQALATIATQGSGVPATIGRSLASVRNSVCDVLGAPKRVVVIGAGPAGLAAAWALAGKGLDVRVVHPGKVTGGKAESFWTGSRSTEHGVHGWWPGYVNFDRMLRDAGVDLEADLAHANGTGVLSRDGALDFVRRTRAWLPFPWFLLVYAWRPKLYPVRHLFSLLRFAVHLLAFDHARDYEQYDSQTLDQLARNLRVHDTIRQSLVAPFAPLFDYATATEVSAASILSAMQFYLLPSQDSIVPRWSRGLPDYKIFEPLKRALEARGVVFERSAEVMAIGVGEEGVTSATVRSFDVPAAGAGETLVARIPVSDVPASGFVNYDDVRSGARLLIGRIDQRLKVYQAVCTHEQGHLRVCPDGLFECDKHRARYRADGSVERGLASQPLPVERVELQGSTLHVFGTPSHTIPCEHVVIATDVRKAAALLNQGPLQKRAPRLCEDVSKLTVTSVVVVRFWLQGGTRTPGPQTIVLPFGEFADVYFDLGQIDGSYDGEGVVIELHSSDPGGIWSERTDEQIVEGAFKDLRKLSASFQRSALVAAPNYEIRRHKEVFTLYAPNQHRLRPRAATPIPGLHLAGDWTQADYAVWMMERGVVSGLRAANSVLRAHQLPSVELLAAPDGNLVRRLARRITRTLLGRSSRSGTPERLIEGGRTERSP